MDEKDEDTIAGLVLDSSRRVKRALGNAFPQEAYRGALVADLRAQGLKVHERVPLCRESGWYSPAGAETVDAIVESRVVVEVKAVGHLSEAHQAAAMARLCLSRLTFGLLVNFGYGGPGDDPESVTTVVARPELGFEDWLEQEEDFSLVLG